ncbi:MAG: membrane protein insertion efficiency factor YidD [Verrucomicrobia bacterium]|nr:MAG: membrane protein insertion efficiency factor YidD [Verrucomicrobiota bacterium]
MRFFVGHAASQVVEITVSPTQFILTSAVRVYRWVLSPTKAALFGSLGRCRFTPTCSQYALEAIQQHGSLRGSWLAVRRICRCHPWGECGHDPVPERSSRPQTSDSQSQGLPADGLRKEMTHRALGTGCSRNR